jgi:hypothetical protein
VGLALAFFRADPNSVLFVDHIDVTIQDHCTDLSERDFTPEPRKLGIQFFESNVDTCISAVH